MRAALTRWSRALASIAGAALLGGCATSAVTYLDQVGYTRSGLERASGIVHNELAGVHFISSMTWIKNGSEPPSGALVSVHSTEHGDWSLTFAAYESNAAAARDWFAANGPELDTKFGAMVDFVRSAYPGSVARRFRVIALPPGSRIDRMWPQLALTERNLEMTFALPLPGDPRDGDETLPNVNPLIAHEFSHSYFWFHPEKLRNNYSDEVVAYTTQRCAEVAMYGGSYATTLEPKFEAFDKEVAGLSPGAIYARLHEKYPDTYLALFAASNEFRRLEREWGGEAERKIGDYCRSLPMSAKDFTTAEP